MKDILQAIYNAHKFNMKQLQELAAKHADLEKQLADALATKPEPKAPAAPVVKPA